MKVYSLNVRFKRLINPLKHTITNLQCIIMTYVNIILHIEVAQETTKIIDRNEILVLKDILGLSVTPLTICQSFPAIEVKKSQSIPKTVHAKVLICRAFQVVLALVIDIHAGVMNIHILIHPYAACYVFDATVDSIYYRP